ncbi:putative ABC transport system permease protein [Filimonas lacunae]|uniref:Putative ABC transport system permease protein n=1 Tax=Filimonas lacunae TaxID=477680 RepID=A0A173MFF8_9BACT|nr:ABC transporter permease [Filimonas lacunae]BAV06236.1 ABC transporter, permease protein [Filimonas lacunae]SIT25395.1 putative ABC transport system permease protein [Filimonas lacunae]
MFINYLKIAWRNLIKNKTYTFINLFGLITGITCCLLIGLYIHHELSFDKFQAKGNRIVRVIMEYSAPGSEASKGNFTSARVFPVFAQNFPEIESGTRMYESNPVITCENGDQFNEDHLLFTDSTYFRMFNATMLQGNPQTALNGPFKMILTASTAQRYFGTTQVMGKVVKVGASAIPYEITGVIADNPTNSQIQFNSLASFSSRNRKNEEKNYWNANYTTYFLVKKPEQIAALQQKIPAFMRKEMQGENSIINFYLEPFNSIHLHSPYDAYAPNTSITYIYIITAIALLILAIACFTYINLSTARSMERAKEVGIRKVSGALRQQIFWQFIYESFILCLLALLVSIALVYLVLPSFNNLTGNRLAIKEILTPSILGYILFVVTILGLLAGGYPALVLSGFQPVAILKGVFKNYGKGAALRKTLIVFQFVISIFLIIATIIVQKQLHFIQHTRLGYDREHVLVLNTDQKIYDKGQTFKDAFLACPDIKNVSISADAPNQISGGYEMRSATMPETSEINVTASEIDENYLATNGIKILYGENINQQDIKDIKRDTVSEKNFKFILNETAARALGWKPSEAVGKRMFVYSTRPGIVKAVVQDFHFQSLHTPIKPLVLFPGDWGNRMMVKVSGQHMPETIRFMQEQWKKLAPHRPFQYHFLDEDYNHMYQSETRLGSLVNIFAGIAIVLACLGLLGLSSYAVQQRSKEISVRKVLGASVTGLTSLLSKNFLQLVLLSFIVAAPLAWLTMHYWLQGYAYRITISWWIFVLAGTAAVVIALVTVASQTLKAAVQSPVKNLKND